MISILIPVYNYDVRELVKTVHWQLELCNIAFEIKCLDDASEDRFQKQKKDVEQLSNTTYNISKTNRGRISTRQRLAQSADYDYLLFLDADVMPKEETFISKYINSISANYDAVYGGVAYKNEPPGPNYMLRWTYGKTKEEIMASVRQKTPYKSIVSANFLIKKSVFIALNSQITYRGYGSDNHFSHQLKKEGVTVYHIDNYVYHLGIEKSNMYLKKKEAAADALIDLYRRQKTKTHDNHLLKLFKTLKLYRLNYLVAWFYKISQTVLRKNLLGLKPSIMYLQLYRISYMCHKELNS